MPRIIFPADTGAKLRRAFRNANKPGMVGACFWCGHGYAEYSEEIASEHIAKCHILAYRDPGGAGPGAPAFGGQQGQGGDWRAGHKETHPRRQRTQDAGGHYRHKG